MKHLIGFCTASLAALVVASACVTDLGDWHAEDINDAGVIVGKRATRAVVRLPSGELKELPNFPGDSQSEAIAVNGSGVVVGNGTSASGRHPVIWDIDGSVRSLGQLNGLDTRALDVNDAGVVVGIASQSSPARFFAWVYDPKIGQLEELPRSASAWAMSADAINDRGEIVGTAGYLTGSRPLKWDLATRALSYLQLPAVSDSLTVTDINESGVVVGSFNARPVVWKSSSELPTFLSTGTWTHGHALGINDAGVIVGKLQGEPTGPLGFDRGKATLWTVEGVAVDLDPDGTVDGSVASEAVAINASGAVVGNTHITPENPGGRATRFR